MQSADVVIIGGGAVGASIAYRLAEAGIQVTLLERESPGSGTSGATFAWVGAHGQRPFSYYQLRRASLSLYPRISEELGLDVEYRPQGSLVILKDVKELRLAEREVSELQGEGYELHLLEPAELYALEPGIAHRFAGATYCPLGGSLNPFRLVYGYSNRARELGARIFSYAGQWCVHDRSCSDRVIPFSSRVLHEESAAVTDIRVRNGQVHSVITGSGAIRAKQVVNATGVHAPHVGRMVGLSIPVRPVRGQILVTEPLPPLIRHIVDNTRQTPQGNLLVGRLDEEAGYADACTLDGISKLAPPILKVLPSIRGAHVIRAYSGLRPMPADGLPILGEVEGVKGFFNAVMHSGITLSAIVGVLMAQLILEGGTELPIEDYSLSRFHR